MAHTAPLRDSNINTNMRRTHMNISRVFRSYPRSARLAALTGTLGALAAVLTAQSAAAQESYGSDTGTVREVKNLRVRLPFSEAARAATVEVVDGVVVYEGDI